MKSNGTLQNSTRYAYIDYWGTTQPLWQPERQTHDDKTCLIRNLTSNPHVHDPYEWYSHMQLYATSSSSLTQCRSLIADVGRPGWPLTRRVQLRSGGGGTCWPRRRPSSVVGTGGASLRRRRRLAAVWAPLVGRSTARAPSLSLPARCDTFSICRPGGGHQRLSAPPAAMGAL